MHFWYLRRVTIYPVLLTLNKVETCEGEKLEKGPSLQAEAELSSNVQPIAETEDHPK
jgi:hypothetical protein